MALLTSRAQIEADIQVGLLTTGTVRQVTVGAETTYGHFRVEPEVVIDDTVVSNVPTLTVPLDVPGLLVDASLSITEGTFKIWRKFPGNSPNLVRLALREG